MMNRVEKMIAERNELINDLLNGKSVSLGQDDCNSTTSTEDVVIIWSGFVNAETSKQRQK